MNIKSLNRKLNKKFAGRVTARLSDGCIRKNAYAGNR